jgi:hypothetical protein
LDVPYRLGGNTRETGFDCSGLVHAVYQQTLGLVLPRRAAEQADSTQKIDKDELKPGDLVFFNTMRRSFSHVGIYIGDNKFIHAPRTGSRVRVENMGMKYWQSRFDGARRVSLTGAEQAPKLASAFMSSDDSSTYQLAATRLSERDAAYASTHGAALASLSASDTGNTGSSAALSSSDAPLVELADQAGQAQKTAKTARASKAENTAKTAKTPHGGKLAKRDVKEAKGKGKKSKPVTALAKDDKRSKVKSASGKSNARRA